MKDHIIKKQNPLKALLLFALCLMLFGAGPLAISAQEPIAFTQEATTLRLGQTKTFAINRKEVKWSSSNPKVLKISKSGKAKATGIGQSRITAASGGQRVSVLVSVKNSYTVGIDPGHQKSENTDEEPIGPNAATTKTKMTLGTRGVSTGKPEYVLNLEISHKLAKELRARGYKVVLSHYAADVDMGNIDRAEKLNKKCDVVLRIHADGAAAQAHGASALTPSAQNPYVGNISAACEKLSRCVLDHYCLSTGLTNRGLFIRDDLTGTNWSKVPVTLIEMGFMTNVFDDEYMSSEKGQAKMVKGIANGVDAYFE